MKAEGFQGFRFAKDDSNVLSLYIYDQIGYWGVEAADVAAAIDDAGEVDAINIYINSPGGSVFEGTAIMSLLRRQKAKKTVYVDGIAASMASLIAMVGSDIIIAEGGFLMIHNPAGGVYGEAKDFRKYAELLDMIKRSAIAVYSKRTGIAAEEIASMMDEETWLDATAAIAKGFATKLTEDAADRDAENLVRFDLSCFKNPPLELAAAGIEENLASVNVDRWAKQDKELLCVSAGPVRDSVFEVMAGVALGRADKRRRHPEPQVNPRNGGELMSPDLMAAMRSAKLIGAEATKEAASCALSSWYAAQRREQPAEELQVIADLKAGPQDTIPIGSVLLTDAELQGRIDGAVAEATKAHDAALSQAVQEAEQAVFGRVKDIMGRCRMANLTTEESLEMIGLPVEEVKERLFAQLCEKNVPVGDAGGSSLDKAGDPDERFRKEYRSAGGKDVIGCTEEDYIESRRRDLAGGKLDIFTAEQ